MNWKAKKKQSNKPIADSLKKKINVDKPQERLVFKKGWRKPMEKGS